MKKNIVPEIKWAIKDFFNGKSDKWEQINVECSKCQLELDSFNT